jgi:hypothetical protein
MGMRNDDPYACNLMRNVVFKDDGVYYIITESREFPYSLVVLEGERKRKRIY